MFAQNFLEGVLWKNLQMQGKDYAFYSTGENEFHEPVPGAMETTIRGFYHEQNSYQTQAVSEAAVTAKKPVPMLLCMWDHAERIRPGDRMAYGTKKFVVVEKNDIQGMGIACDISLREVEQWQD